MTIAKTIARAWTEPEFKKKLVGDPHSALAEHGIDVPEGVTVNIVENTDDTVHLVLPVRPAEAADVSMDDLERIAGGVFDSVGDYDCL